MAEELKGWAYDVEADNLYLKLKNVGTLNLKH